MKALGEPVRRKMLGVQGTTRLAKMLKPERTFDVVVEGTRASGTVVAFSRDGELLRAELAVGGEKIDLLHCTRPTP